MVSEGDMVAGNVKALVLVRGLPGSGKTTFAGRLAAKGFRHFEADTYFEQGGVYRHDPDQLPQAHALCQRNAEDALTRGDSVVVSNTSVSMDEIRPYERMAKKHNALWIVFHANGGWQSVHNVPPSVQDGMRRRWQPYPDEIVLNDAQISEFPVHERMPWL